MADGYLNKCKACARADVKANREARADYYKKSDKARANLPHRVQARIAYSKTSAGRVAQSRARVNYRVRYPDRTVAVQALNNAVRDGRVKPQPCWVCGEKAQAHHPDYSAPLDVVWLCQAHHKAVHAAAELEPA